MIWTHDEEREKKEIEHTEYVAQWEKDNERVLSRDGRFGRPKPATKSDDVSTHSMEGKQEKPFPRQEVDNG
jgi:hypothetical protein